MATIGIEEGRETSTEKAERREEAGTGTGTEEVREVGSGETGEETTGETERKMDNSTGAAERTGVTIRGEDEEGTAVLVTTGRISKRLAALNRRQWSLSTQCPRGENVGQSARSICWARS